MLAPTEKEEKEDDSEYNNDSDDMNTIGDKLNDDDEGNKINDILPKKIMATKSKLITIYLG